MRLVNRSIRDVKPARLAINRRTPLWQPFSRNPRLSTTLSQDAFRLPRLFATTAERPTGLVVTQDLPQSLQPLALAPRARADKAFVQDATSFGKWQWLLTNSGRLAIETDFDRKGPARRWKKTLLVDHVDNHGDFELWGCLLQHLQRLEGARGVQKLWNAFWGRKSLYQLESMPDKIFWTTIVEAALRLGDEKFLSSVYLYAEFMGEVHHVQWPDLYTTIVPYFLRTGQHQKAVKWHIRLMPNFYPGSHDFINMVRDFATNRTLNASFALQSLYIASPERRLYDAIVPYLYGRGESILARHWRKVCIAQDDAPRVYAPSRQFIRYLQGYFHNDLHPREVAAVSDQSQSLPGGGEQQVEVSREFMNHVHGRTFGFTAKTYNDELGSRWFASSWVSLDFATSVVAALGIQQIGPLSMQSICIREGTSAGVLTRIVQLEIAGISVPTSGYAKTIQHFAKIGDEELLMRLLHCDIHPDVFDDVELQARLMASSSAAGDLSTYTLLLASRLACVTDSTRATVNKMLQLHLTEPNYQAVLHILDDVRGVGVPLDVETCKLFFSWIFTNVGMPAGQTDPQQLNYALAVCQRLNNMDVPVPASCWARITYALGRGGFLDKLYSLCAELIDHYTIRQSSRPGFIPINKDDVPRALTEPLAEVENLLGLYIPGDTPPRLPAHPLSRIFSSKWQTDLIRWSFRQSPRRPKFEAPFVYSRTEWEKAIDILRRLRERGVRVKDDKVRKALYIRLAELYGENPAARRIQQRSREVNAFSLSEVKRMIDDAWGSELLPPIAELHEKIMKFDRGYLKKYVEHGIRHKAIWEAKHPSRRLGLVHKRFQKQGREPSSIL